MQQHEISFAAVRFPDADVAGVGIRDRVDYGQHLVSCGQVGEDDPAPQAVPVLRFGRGGELGLLQSEVLLQVIADRPHPVCGKTGVECVCILRGGISFQVDVLDPERVVSRQAGRKAVDARQLAAVVGESAQQYRTALREMHDGGDPFAAPFGGVRGDEERQPRLYGSRDFSGDQRRQGGPAPGATPPDRGKGRRARPPSTAGRVSRLRREPHSPTCFSGRAG